MHAEIFNLVHGDGLVLRGGRGSVTFGKCAEGAYFDFACGDGSVRVDLCCQSSFRGIWVGVDRDVFAWGMFLANCLLRDR